MLVVRRGKARANAGGRAYRRKSLGSSAVTPRGCEFLHPAAENLAPMAEPPRSAHRRPCRVLLRGSCLLRSCAVQHGAATIAAPDADAARLRQLALTVHVLASVGWIGAVATFPRARIGRALHRDTEKARACYVAMEVATRTVILPLAIACVATGLVQSLGTRWGLFRHYWVVTKMVIAVISTALLVLHMRPIAIAADAAAGQQLFDPA